MTAGTDLRLAAGVVTIFGSLLIEGCQAKAPGAFETRLMQNAKRRLTVRGRGDLNPLSATDENIRLGQKNFASFCMVCHGLDGQNTGVPFADKMSPPVPSLSSTAVQAYTDGQLHWIIRNGISPSGMPASKDVFHDEEIWQLVLYVRHLPQKGSLGTPSIYGRSFQQETPAQSSALAADLNELGLGSYPRKHP